MAVWRRCTPEDQSRLRADDAAARELSDGEVLQLRYRERHNGGTWHWMSRRITPFRRNCEGKVVQVLCVTRDVTDAVQAMERLTHAALHESLTGLPNRALLIDRLNTALARATRERRVVAVLFCDLDGFKQVNDTFGHAKGDAVLVVVAQRISGVLRDWDTVARVGGDEFVLLVEPWDRPIADETSGEPDGDRDLALQLADRIASALRQPVVIDGVQHVVTASIGITYTSDQSLRPDGSATADQVLADADAAMYHAKSLGKDRTEVSRHAW